MTTVSNQQTPAGAELIASPMGLIDPEDFKNQSGAAIEDDETEEDELDEAENDDPLDEDGDPTGEHDHHQDDNYALGGHVTRSGGV